MKHAILALAAGALLLAGCASIPSDLPGSQPSVGDSLQKLGAFTIADINAADVIAVANNDTEAHMCFAAGHGINKFVSDQQQLTGGSLNVTGAISAFEAGRVTIHGAAAGAQVPQYLIDDCAPLVASVKLDAAGFLAQLAAFGIKP